MTDTNLIIMPEFFSCCFFVWICFYRIALCSNGDFMLMVSVEDRYIGLLMEEFMCCELAVTMLITMSVLGSRLHCKILWMVWFTLLHSSAWMVSLPFCVCFSLHWLVDSTF